MDWTVNELLLIALVGLIGGTMGGMLGLGGSIFAIPTLTLLFGSNQHLYQSAALIANVFVASAATLRHRGRGTIRRDVVPVMASATTIAALAGVATSNLIPSRPLSALFGCFLLYAVGREVTLLLRKTPDHPHDDSARCSPVVSATTGLIGGFAAGLLGIGGGAVMVPILRGWGKLPLRQAVASAAAAMIVACTIGAIAKNATIGSLRAADGTPLTLQSSLVLAAALSPTAMIGGSLGAALVYRIPVNTTRIVLSVFLLYAGTRMILVGLGR